MMKKRYEALLVLNAQGTEDTIRDIIERLESEFKKEGAEIEQVQKMDERQKRWPRQSNSCKTCAWPALTKSFCSAISHGIRKYGIRLKAAQFAISELPLTAFIQPTAAKSAKKPRLSK